MENIGIAPITVSTHAGMTYQNTLTENAGYDDNSDLHPTCGPDWDAIEMTVDGFGNIEPNTDDFIAGAKALSAERIEDALIVIRALAAWTYQNGSRNMDGKAIRCAIVEKIVLPHLQPLTLTQLAKGYGKHKQSFGRWVDHFKLTFPSVKTCHMKNE